MNVSLGAVTSRLLRCTVTEKSVPPTVEWHGCGQIDQLRTGKVLGMRLTGNACPTWTIFERGSDFERRHMMEHDVFYHFLLKRTPQ
tara:strand:- start:1197 stop:1454 length:258 start_codon:yes stop_codon:yes gene_type:complete